MVAEHSKAAIDLRDGKEHGALIETREGGKEHTYYPSRSPIHWDCERLTVRQGFAFKEKGELGPPKVLTYVTGVARRRSNYGISVIGGPAKQTRIVDVFFKPDDSPDLLQDNEPDTEGIRINFSCSYGRASLGYSSRNWELGTSDQWWLECRLHSSALQPLIDAVSTSMLEQATVSVGLNEVYTTEPPYVPFSSDEPIYLRPSKRDNSTTCPEIAHGWLEGLGLELGSVNIAPPPEPDPDERLEEAAPHPTIQASQAMGIHIEALRQTVMSIGGLIALALFLLLLLK